jgi:hypothetical protein
MITTESQRMTALYGVRMVPFKALRKGERFYFITNAKRQACVKKDARRYVLEDTGETYGVPASRAVVPL